MRKKTYKLCLAAILTVTLITGCGEGKSSTETEEAQGTSEETANDSTGQKDSVIVAMGTNSEPESGFDPAYGWGAGEHVHEPLDRKSVV